MRNSCSQRQRSRRWTPGERAKLETLAAQHAGTLLSSQQEITDTSIELAIAPDAAPAPCAAPAPDAALPTEGVIEIGAEPARQTAAEASSAPAGVVAGVAAGVDIPVETSATNSSAAPLPAALGCAACLRYVREKRAPQLQMLLRRIGKLLSCRQCHLILILGCGFSELGIALARLWPRSQVLCVDTVPDAISRGRLAAAGSGLRNIRLVLEDPLRLRMQLAGGGATGDLSAELTRVGLVVALHACGGLADAALSLASRNRASALVGACCFSKDHALCPADAAWGLPPGERELLCQMADGADEGYEALLARRVVAALRLEAARRRRPEVRYTRLLWAQRAERLDLLVVDDS